MKPRYRHADTLWTERVRQAEATLDRLIQAQVTHQFTDKWGHPLSVGDLTDKGLILEIVAGCAVTEQGRYPWTYLKKLEIKK
jgi:hypothetical protein